MIYLSTKMLLIWKKTIDLYIILRQKIDVHQMKTKDEILRIKNQVYAKNIIALQHQKTGCSLLMF